MCIRERRSHWRAGWAVAQSLPWGLLYLLRLYCVLATAYSLRHTKRLMSTTVSDMMRIAAASSANLAPNQQEDHGREQHRGRERCRDLDDWLHDPRQFWRESDAQAHGQSPQGSQDNGRGYACEGQEIAPQQMQPFTDAHGYEKTDDLGKGEDQSGCQQEEQNSSKNDGERRTVRHSMPSGCRRNWRAVGYVARDVPEKPRNQAAERVADGGVCSAYPAQDMRVVKEVQEP